MKIQTKHYNMMQDVIEQWVNNLPNGKKSLLDWMALCVESGLSGRRIRSDIIHLSGLTRMIGQSHNDAQIPVYDYAEDDHIDTAMRKIVKRYTDNKHITLK